MKPDSRIQRLIPHRGAMALIETIISMDTATAEAQAIVRDTWPTSDGREVSALLMVELVAQAAGLVDGQARLSGCGSAPKGWLVGIKSLDLMVDAMAIGATVTIKAGNRFEFEDFKEIQGEVHLDGRLAGQMTLQVMRAPQDGAAGDTMAAAGKQEGKAIDG